MIKQKNVLNLVVLVLFISFYITSFSIEAIEHPMRTSLQSVKKIESNISLCSNNSSTMVFENGVGGVFQTDFGLDSSEKLLQLDKPIHNIKTYDNLVFISLDNQIVCFDLRKKDVGWTYENRDLSDSYSVVFIDKKLFIGYSKGLLVVDMKKGQVLNSLNKGSKVRIHTNSYILILSFKKNGKRIIQRVDPSSLAKIWELDNPSEYVDFHDIQINQNIVMMIKTEHSLPYLMIVDNSTGKVISEKLYEDLSSYFVIDDEVFLIQKNTSPPFGYEMRMTNLDNNSFLWSRKIPSNSIEQVSILGNSLLFFSKNTVYLLDTKDGFFQQIFRFKNSISQIDAKSEGILLIQNSGHNSSKIHLISPATDSLSFQISSNKYTPDDNSSVEMDSEPIIKNGRTLLPARFVTEPLGGQVFWDGDERKVTCKLVAPDNHLTEEYKENIVELWINKPTAKVNGQEVQIDPNNPDVVPTIINDRTMVPMRFLAESLGCEVEWIAETKEIILTYPNE